MSIPVLGGIDPGRVAAIELASDQAKKTIEAQEKAQLLMTTGHAWIKEEVETTTDFQREFNDYLARFHDVLSIAAEIYGIYYEVTQTSKCVKDVGQVLSESPTNALAVAFSTRRNVVYRGRGFLHAPQCGLSQHRAHHARRHHGHPQGVL